MRKLGTVYAHSRAHTQPIFPHTAKFSFFPSYFPGNRCEFRGGGGKRISQGGKSVKIASGKVGFETDFLDDGALLVFLSRFRANWVFLFFFQKNLAFPYIFPLSGRGKTIQGLKILPLLSNEM